MRVKRLEIQGFKSFKDKTVIHFDHTITGIVGPNGCGKSNIVDAFFWVMGEQSYKHMRGNSSEDLIFNGSSKYSPMGLAEATLVMETGVTDTANAPAGATVQDVPVQIRSKEISVTRRLYRSGEGEYFINGTLSRLKDIQELFMDTGVGAKGYSVIEQGQIGKIVNAKPEERRLLIEEAAGIAKYKARKKESLRKMEATQANLSRLTDIIQEIEKSLASLDRQAQKARQYKKYKDELFEKEIAWGRRKSKILQQKLDLLRSQRDGLEHELLALRAELQIGENTIEIEQVELITETKEAEFYQSKIQDLGNELSDKKSSLELSRRRQGDLVSQLQLLGKEQDQLNVSIEADQLRLKNLEDQIQEANHLFQNMKLEVAQLSESVATFRRETDHARSQVDSTQKALMQGMNQISSLTSKSAGLLSKVEHARGQAERLTQQENSQVQKLNEIGTELEKSKAAVDSIRDQRENLRTKREEQSHSMEAEEENYTRLEKEKNQSLRTFTEFKSRLASLEELDESHEGLADGPKAALDWAKARPKNHTALEIVAFTDLLDVRAGYETALESWLENRIEHLIAFDSEVALPLLEQLKVGKLGRVGIQLIPQQSSQLPNSSESSKSLKDIQAILEANDFKVLGELSQFVKTTHPDSQSLNQLFQRVCVVESSGPLASFFQKQTIANLSGWSIVSLDGIALESQGILRGGSFNSSGAAGILRRKKLIEDLKDQVIEAERRHSDLDEATFQSKGGIDLLRAQLKSLQSEYQQLEIQLAALERDVHQIERAQKEAQRSLDAIRRDSGDMGREAERALNDREAIDLNLKGLTESRKELEEVLSSAEKVLTEKEELFRAQDGALQSVRVQEASLRERAGSLKREKEAVQSVTSDRERRRTEIQKVFERATQEKTHHTGGESELHEKIEELTINLAHLREKLSDVKDKIEQANAKVNRNLDKVKILHKQGDEKTSESTQLALDIEKLSGELSHLTLNLEEKYGPQCLALPEVNAFQEEMAPPIVTLEISAEEEIILNEEVERLRERIRRLGEVNVMAIEEFELLKKRFDHLINEKGDLERSLENLKDAIDHINKTSEDRFAKAFESIADRFERLFPVIFGGGQAKLSLVYPEGSKDILDAGVDILAQPPGKKVTNIGLLSGGEKALTAVSLIFAIFMVKPSPFCVLDEVDAPLDDANIGRFNALLREMSSKSQFILITHNKKTMELNDTLYGVTMEEPGVSKMVSIEMH